MEEGLVVTRIPWRALLKLRYGRGIGGGWVHGTLDWGLWSRTIGDSGAERMKLKPSGSVSLSSLGISRLLSCKMGKDTMRLI